MTGNNPNISKIEGYNSGRAWVEAYEVGSHSRPDVFYVVAKSYKGTWGCSCPRWTFNRKSEPNAECKHIREVKAALSLSQVAAKPLAEASEKVQKALSRFALLEV